MFELYVASTDGVILHEAFEEIFKREQRRVKAIEYQYSHGGRNNFDARWAQAFAFRPKSNHRKYLFTGRGR